MTPPSLPGALVSFNPATGEEVARYVCASTERVETMVALAAKCARSAWGHDVQVRATVLRAVAAELRTGIDDFARTVTAEVGRPLVESRGEVARAADVCDYYARHAADWLAPQPVPSDAAQSFVCHDPLGVVLAIMPWNLPIWQAFRMIAPAIAAGNTVLLKHAPNVSGCAVEIADAFERAGAPAGAMQTLLIDVPATEGLILDPRVRMIGFIGSDTTGARVASLAGQGVKKLLLELGGSDAFIVLDDADVARAVEAGAGARFRNCGQTCLSPKRFLVQAGVREAFEAGMIAFARALRVGDPTDPAVHMGPVARADLRAQVHRQVEATIAQGAMLRLGGEMPEGPGFFYPPTVLTGCRPEMAAFTEEVFGPVAAIMEVADAHEAVAFANASPFGLGASVWTDDAGVARRIARDLDVGGVFVNGVTHSHLELPFGGTKRSGYGRDLGRQGLIEFVNMKTLWIGPTP